jgi:hypothetical protein
MLLEKQKSFARDILSTMGYLGVGGGEHEEKKIL